MKLWTIKQPDYRSDREELANNGKIKFPFGLPGVTCCGTWSGCDILGKECPAELRKLRGLTDVWPVSAAQIEQLRTELRKFPDFSKLGLVELPPGVRFLPPRFSPPRIVENDFLWPALEAPIVSKGVASLLAQFCSNDFIGVPITEHGEWVLLIIKNRTLPPIERRSNRICQRCGRPNKISAETDLVISEDMVPAGDLFMLDTTLYILMSNHLKQQLEDAGVRNVVFEETVITPKKHKQN